MSEWSLRESINGKVKFHNITTFLYFDTKLPEMRIVLLIFCTLMAGVTASAQNLVPNPSFETNTGLPTGPGQYNRVVGWHNVNGGPAFTWPWASPDYLHTSGSGGAQLPNSTFGTVTAYNGNAVMSGALWYSIEFREYIACQLTSPMTIGQSYDVTIHVTNGTSSFAYGIYGPQIALSVNPLFQLDHEPILYTPQMVPSAITYSTSWLTMTYNITATQAFQHMTVGNFYNDVNTIRQAMGGGTGGAYYFYDGMSVTESIVLDDGSLELSGMSSGKTNVLEWTLEGAPVTTSSTAFTVWRSQDGEQYQMIEELAAGSGMSFKDVAPRYGLNWYKIRKKNLDGSVSWSNVVRLENNEENVLQVISVYPNPLNIAAGNTEITVKMEHPAVPGIDVSIFDATGRKVLDRYMPALGQRMSIFSLPVSELAAGTYSLRLQAGSTFATRPFVVVR